MSVQGQSRKPGGRIPRLFEIPNTLPGQKLAETELGLWAVIASVTAAVFVSDLLTPLGVAVWVIYLGPVVLSFFLWQPAAPLLLAAIATSLATFGFFIWAQPSVLGRVRDVLCEEPHDPDWHRRLGV